MKPINDLTVASETFAYDNPENREKNTELMKSLNIQTGDEIENLYKAMKKTTIDVSNYLAEISQKAALISKMQDNIIISFANMVESRDVNTGTHIKHTAAYVRAIGIRMQQEGYNPQQLTNEYIENLTKSAPLHDIGKVHISDTILNKPGKLTPEEFSIMKTHTIIGGKILLNALKGIEGSTYLSMAIDLATYHHERWDGKGYPTGLVGKDIPLCARIMAVADVFDALISKRSYKEGFPFDDAVKMIVEESGTHFDPDVVEAFVSITPQIREIAADEQV